VKTVGVFEARTHLSQLLVEVEKNEEFIIQKRGKNVALLQSFNNLEKENIEKRAGMILSAFREIRESQNSAKKGSSSVKELINSQNENSIRKR